MIILPVSLIVTGGIGGAGGIASACRMRGTRSKLDCVIDNNMPVSMLTHKP